jgi:DmsE family decaheme c-type cytochrome
MKKTRLRARPLASWLPALVLAVLAWYSPHAAAQSQAEICVACHQGYVESFQASIHGRKGHPRTPAGATAECSACHGNVLEHAKQGGGRGTPGLINPGPKSRIPAAEKDQICLTCHQGNRHLAFWESGRHARNDVACTNCHSTHGGNPQLLNIQNPPIRPIQTTTRVPQQEVCFACHRDIRAQFMRPSHHPVVEGQLKCSSCHNPHGALTPAMVNNESINKLCTSCHADKRGPFIFDHPPVEENCLNCHTPHGARSAKLLKEKVPNLCQDCHDASQHPGTMYDQRNAFTGPSPANRFFARGCLNCHNEVHGSNHPASRGRRFVR